MELNATNPRKRKHGGDNLRASLEAHIKAELSLSCLRTQDKKLLSWTLGDLAVYVYLFATEQAVSPAEALRQIDFYEAARFIATEQGVLGFVSESSLRRVSGSMASRYWESRLAEAVASFINQSAAALRPQGAGSEPLPRSDASASRAAAAARPPSNRTEEAQAPQQPRRPSVRHFSTQTWGPINNAPTAPPSPPEQRNMPSPSAAPPPGSGMVVDAVPAAAPLPTVVSDPGSRLNLQPKRLAAPTLPPSQPPPPPPPRSPQQACQGPEPSNPGPGTAPACSLPFPIKEEPDLPGTQSSAPMFDRQALRQQLLRPAPRPHAPPPPAQQAQAEPQTAAEPSVQPVGARADTGCQTTPTSKDRAAAAGAAAGAIAPKLEPQNWDDPAGRGQRYGPAGWAAPAGPPAPLPSSSRHTSAVVGDVTRRPPAASGLSFGGPGDAAAAAGAAPGQRAGSGHAPAWGLPAQQPTERMPPPPPTHPREREQQQQQQQPSWQSAQRPERSEWHPRLHSPHCYVEPQPSVDQEAGPSAPAPAPALAPAARQALAGRSSHNAAARQASGAGWRPSSGPGPNDQGPRSQRQPQPQPQPQPRDVVDVHQPRQPNQQPGSQGPLQSGPGGSGPGPGSPTSWGVTVGTAAASPFTGPRGAAGGEATAALGPPQPRAAVAASARDPGPGASAHGRGGSSAAVGAGVAAGPSGNGCGQREVEAVGGGRAGGGVAWASAAEEPPRHKLSAEFQRRLTAGHLEAKLRKHLQKQGNSKIKQYCRKEGLPWTLLDVACFGTAMQKLAPAAPLDFQAAARFFAYVRGWTPGSDAAAALDAPLVQHGAHEQPPPADLVCRVAAAMQAAAAKYKLADFIERQRTRQRGGGGNSGNGGPGGEPPAAALPVAAVAAGSGGAGVPLPQHQGANGKPKQRQSQNQSERRAAAGPPQPQRAGSAAARAPPLPGVGLAASGGSAGGTQAGAATASAVAGGGPGGAGQGDPGRLRAPTGAAPMPMQGSRPSAPGSARVAGGPAAVGGRAAQASGARPEGAAAAAEGPVLDIVDLSLEDEEDDGYGDGGGDGGYGAGDADLRDGGDSGDGEDDDGNDEYSDEDGATAAAEEEQQDAEGQEEEMDAEGEEGSGSPLGAAEGAVGAPAAYGTPARRRLGPARSGLAGHRPAARPRRPGPRGSRGGSGRAGGGNAPRGGSCLEARLRAHLLRLGNSKLRQHNRRDGLGWSLLDLVVADRDVRLQTNCDHLRPSEVAQRIAHIKLPRGQNVPQQTLLAVSSTLRDAHQKYQLGPFVAAEVQKRLGRQQRQQQRQGAAAEAEA